MAKSKKSKTESASSVEEQNPGTPENEAPETETPETGSETAAPGVGSNPPGDGEDPRQHPALDGDVERENAERSADVVPDEASYFERDIVMLKSDYDDERAGDLHERNGHAVRQDLISQGLRPTEDKPTVSKSNHPDGASVILKYKIGVIPAVIAEDPEVANAKVVPDSDRDDTSAPAE